jgi:hypothetical protein
MRKRSLEPVLCPTLLEQPFPGRVAGVARYQSVARDREYYFCLNVFVN